MPISLANWFPENCNTAGHLILIGKMVFPFIHVALSCRSIGRWPFERRQRKYRKKPERHMIIYFLYTWLFVYNGGKFIGTPLVKEINFGSISKWAG